MFSVRTVRSQHVQRQSSRASAYIPRCISEPDGSYHAQDKDLVLCPYDALWQIRNIRSDRRQALATHHFLVEAVVEAALGRKDKRDGGNHKNI